MATQTQTADRPTWFGIDVLRRSWGWYLALGIVLLLIGVAAIVWSAAATIASVVVFGWMLMAGGVLQAIHGFTRKKWGGFFIDLVVGILYFVTGFMLVGNPAASALALTLIIAAFLLIAGIFRIVVSASASYPGRGWGVFHGVVSILLGIGIWLQWPVSGLWVIGLFVGIELLLDGVSLMTLAFGARRLPKETERVGPPPAAPHPPGAPA